MDRITIDVTRTRGSSGVTLRAHASTPDNARFAYSAPARSVRLPEGAALDATCVNDLLEAIAEVIADIPAQLPF